MDATSQATFWVFMGLLAFLGLMVYLKVPSKAAGALDKRADDVRSNIEEARKLREEAQALLADYQRKRQEAEEEAKGIIDLAKREAAALGEEAKTRMEEYVERRTKAVEQRIAMAESQALADVRASAVEVASRAAAQIVAAKAEGDVGDKLIDASIAGLKDQLN
jgi:F-type H+-transporting ATPase subunit b